MLTLSSLFTLVQDETAEKVVSPYHALLACYDSEWTLIWK